jgi:S1-C subfamily serine protease
MRSLRRLSGPALAFAVAATLAVSPAFARSSAATAAKPGVVDVETTLGLQGGAAAGTGIVLTASGEVLTNNHVIQGATTVKVVLPGTKTSWKARVVGYSVSADVAVLRLTGASGLKTVRVGDSSSLRVGQHVQAIGNARGKGTLTHSTGMITALGRTITAGDGQSSERLTGLIQTDASLQPGDSGGPLLDTSGRVIGIDTAATTSFVFQGSSGGGYAIPIAHALSVARQIDSGRSSTTVHVGPTAFLGIEVGRPSAGDTPRGVPVAGVLPDSPAEKAGLGAGDTVTALDGHAVASSNALVRLLLQRRPGTTATVTWRDVSGTRRSARVTLASGPPQ